METEYSARLSDNVRIVDFIDESLAMAIAQAIIGFQAPRAGQTLAEIVDNVLCMDGTRTFEYFPGYNAALDKMSEGANEIISGWFAADSKLGLE